MEAVLRTLDVVVGRSSLDTSSTLPPRPYRSDPDTLLPPPALSCPLLPPPAHDQERGGGPSPHGGLRPAGGYGQRGGAGRALALLYPTTTTPRDRSTTPRLHLKGTPRPPRPPPSLPRHAPPALGGRVVSGRRRLRGLQCRQLPAALPAVRRRGLPLPREQPPLPHRPPPLRRRRDAGLRLFRVWARHVQDMSLTGPRHVPHTGTDSSVGRGVVFLCLRGRP